MHILSSLFSSAGISRPRAHLSTSFVSRNEDPSKALAHREARQITIDQSLRSKEELEHEKLVRGKFIVEGPLNVAITSVTCL
jgi:hypothetical protein